MMTIPSIRDASLATLLIFGFGSSCVIVREAPPPTHEATPPREASKPAPARGPSKPATQPKPAPAHGPSKPLPAKKPVTAKPAQPRPGPQAKPATPPKPRPIAKPAPIARPAPAPRPAPEAPPSVPTTTQLVVPVRVAFADAVARIDALVLRSAKQDWRTVSDPKAPTRVEVRYTAWRDPIEATYDDRTLRVGVTVRYAADVRASAKNPLGGGRIWITKGESWGTKSKPQVIAAKFHAVFTVQDDLSVKAEVALDDIDHGEAPSGDVCVKAIAQLCVSKGSIAPMVRRNLERQLVPQIEEALADADRQIEQALNLRPHAQRLWTALQQPQPLHGVGAALCPAAAGPACATPAWLVTRPESLGISQPRMDGADLRVDLAFAGQLAVQLGARPRTKPTPLPKLKPVTDPPGFAVRAKLQVPLAALTDELDRRLKDEAQAMVGAPGIVVTQVTLVTDFDPRNRRRLGVVVSLGGAVTADVVLFGELAWDAARRELFVRDFDYAVDSADAALQQLSARNQTAIRNAIAKKARWKLDARAAGLGAAITDALDGVWRGHLDVDGALSQMHVEGVSRDQDTLTAEVVLAGQLGVTFTP